MSNAPNSEKTVVNAMIAVRRNLLHQTLNRIAAERLKMNSHWINPEAAPRPTAERAAESLISIKKLEETVERLKGEIDTLVDAAKHTQDVR